MMRDQEGSTLDGDADSQDHEIEEEYEHDSELNDDDRMLQNIILYNFMARQKVTRLSNLQYHAPIDNDDETGILKLSSRLSTEQMKLLGTISST